MPYLYSHLQTASNIVATYDGSIPLQHHLKQFFSKEKKYGSKDRRTIAALCYQYYRIGVAMKTDNIRDRLLTAFFLFTQEPNRVLAEEQPVWNVNTGLEIFAKAALAGVDVNRIFPFNHGLSPTVNAAAFNRSHLLQPDVFIRARPGFLSRVQQQLTEAGITHRLAGQDCVAVAASTPIEKILKLNAEAVIQDISSQRIAELLTMCKLPIGASVWDCCAASGGKSILAVDVLPAIRLTVSDIRTTIMHNLQRRFAEADIKDYKALTVDVGNTRQLARQLGNQQFNLIICDAPCSGSGTWGRTPEHLLYCPSKKIDDYSQLQKQIVNNARHYLAPGGYFLYITCSALEAENEAIVRYLLKFTELTVVKQQLFAGYEMKGDTMFASLFRLEK